MKSARQLDEENDCRRDALRQLKLIVENAIGRCDLTESDTFDVSQVEELLTEMQSVFSDGSDAIAALRERYAAIDAAT